MKYGPLMFPVVPHKYLTLFHHLELYPFYANFGSPSGMVPFLRSGEDIGCSREIVECSKLS